MHVYSGHICGMIHLLPASLLYRQLHSAEVSDLRAQLDSVSAQLLHYQQCHSSCSLLMHSQAELLSRADAHTQMQHTTCQTHLHEQKLPKQQHEQQIAAASSGDSKLSPSTTQIDVLRVCHSSCAASANQCTANASNKQMQMPGVQTLQQRCEKQSAEISMLGLQLQAAVAELDMLKTSCSQSAMPSNEQAAQAAGAPQSQCEQTSSTSIRSEMQHEHWMRHLPELLHWKRGGFPLVRKALRKWAAVTKAESLHRR